VFVSQVGKNKTPCALTVMAVNDEFGRTWKEDILAYCEFPSWELSASDRGNPPPPKKIP